MAHISSIGAGLYSSLIVRGTQTGTGSAATFALAAATARPTNGFTDTQSNPSTGFVQAFPAASAATGLFAAPNVRELPAVGSPANVVNVPRYGSTTTLQISGQADAPSLEFTFNYVPGDAVQRALQGDVGSATNRTFIVRLSNGSAGGATGAQLAATDEFSDFMFNAQVSSFLVTPSLTDSNQATMTLAVQTDIDGPLTRT